ncbi:MAG: response regulator [Polyangia bacterium]
MTQDPAKTDDMLTELRARFLPAFITDSRGRLRDALGLLSPVPAGLPGDPSLLAVAAAMHVLAGEAMLIGLPTHALLARAAGGAARRYLETRSSVALIACARALRSLARAVEELELAATLDGASAVPLSVRDPSSAPIAGPVAEPAPAATNEAEEPARPRPRVLVVDDSALNAALLREGLEYAGFDASALGDDAAAILVHLHQHRPQVLLLDWVMPGCDTRELCRQIQSAPELAAVRILLITSLPEVEAAEHARELGAVAALTKELGIPTVVARVRALLKEPA